MIQMTGTDHTLASVETRSLFSFTKSEQAQVMQKLREELGADGIVVINTCNRTEFWVDTDKDHSEVFHALCRVMNVKPKQYVQFFKGRSGFHAVKHLFYLSCGLESAILAEDQILTQVKQSLDFARELGTTDGMLEVLFRTAITAAKKVKTEVAFTRADSTAIGQAIKILKKEGRFHQRSKCLVIGNGQYGKLAATELLKAGGDVMVTVRQYHKGHVEVPEGCRKTYYDDRFYHIPDCDVVVSATTSPHHTISYEELEPLELTKPVAFYDLAVPADIDPKIAELANVTLYNIDDFHTDRDPANDGAFRKADMILQKYMHDYREYEQTHDMIPIIQNIQDEGVKDFHQRIRKVLQKLPVDEQTRTELSDEIDSAAGRTMRKLLFDLYDYMDDDEYRSAIEGMEKIYE